MFDNFNNMPYLEMQNMKYKISRLSNTGKPQEDFVYANIREFLNSSERDMMITAQAYYGNDNDINKRKRYYIDRKGVKTETQLLANAKLSHPVFRKIVNQKINYALSKEFSVDCEDTAFAQKIEERFDLNFRKLLKNTGKNAVVNGIAWLQAYYDGESNLKFKRIPSEQIKAFWADSDHTILEAVIRIYTITEYLMNGGTKNIDKVEYYTNEGVWHYIKGDNGLEPDPDKGVEIKGHFIARSQAKGDYDNTVADAEYVWSRIPFIAFKYNSDETSLLKFVKPLIDDYDTNTSDISNLLQDIPNAIKVVKNYEGTDKEEFTHNLHTFRTAFVRENGGIESLNTPIDITAADSHLNRLRKDIYESGFAVDTQIENIGNITGVGLKFRYNDLALDCADLINEFSSAIDNLLWFIKIDMIAKGDGDYLDAKVKIIFNTDMMINESEVISDCKNSAGIISDETIAKNHPWVTDAATEQKRLKAEKQAEIDDYGDAFPKHNHSGGGVNGEE